MYDKRHILNEGGGIMAKSENQKQKLFRILEILMRETDEDHGLTINEIISRLEDYGISAERRSGRRGENRRGAGADRPGWYAEAEYADALRRGNAACIPGPGIRPGSCDPHFG